MFGYLSLVSLVLYFLGSGLILLAPQAKYLVAEEFFEVVKWSVIAVYLLMTYNLLVTTLLGLYYMTDRIHRKDPTFIPPADDSAPPADDDDED